MEVDCCSFGSPLGFWAWDGSAVCTVGAGMVVGRVGVSRVRYARKESGSSRSSSLRNLISAWGMNLPRCIVLD